jgi:hypothetical protein
MSASLRERERHHQDHGFGAIVFDGSHRAAPLDGHRAADSPSIMAGLSTESMKAEMASGDVVLAVAEAAGWP